jgi:hypothetical protein
LGIAVGDVVPDPTLSFVGATGLIGGLILVGLSAILREIVAIAEVLKANGLAHSLPAEMALPARSAIAEPDAADVASASAPMLDVLAPREPLRAPLPDATVEASASAIERLRSSMSEAPKPDTAAEPEEVPLSPNGGQHAPEPEPKVESKPRREGVGSRSSTTAETKDPRLDFLLRSKPATRPSRGGPADSFDALWPKRGARPSEEDSPAEETPAAAVDQKVMREPAPEQSPQPTRRAPEVVAPAAVEPPRSATILKSGVVDGMAYTLYADGSIEAQLPQGTVRFGSIAELRAHIESNS